mmetsp:Transcript_48438/g.52356  ORF Transcript_48438/g.52356 Transcript_48438/m.52356 type:complete len:255 (-) Transcript_48438:192-956(-)
MNPQGNPKTTGLPDGTATMAGTNIVPFDPEQQAILAQMSPEQLQANGFALVPISNANRSGENYQNSGNTYVLNLQQNVVMIQVNYNGPADGTANGGGGRPFITIDSTAAPAVASTGARTLASITDASSTRARGSPAPGQGTLVPVAPATATRALGPSARGEQATLPGAGGGSGPGGPRPPPRKITKKEKNLAMKARLAKQDQAQTHAKKLKEASALADLQREQRRERGDTPAVQRARAKEWGEKEALKNKKKKK